MSVPREVEQSEVIPVLCDPQKSFVAVQRYVEIVLVPTDPCN